LFKQFGTVERVNIITDRDTSQSRGFGFVEIAEATMKHNVPSPLWTEENLMEEH